MTSSLTFVLEDANSTFREASTGSRNSVVVALSFAFDLRVEESALTTLAVVALVETSAWVVVVPSTSLGSSLCSLFKEESFSLFVFNKVGFCL